MNRILVIGCGGAGKSVFSRKLSSIICIPVIHLDSHYWNPGWVRTHRDKWLEQIQQHIRADRWIMDGNYSGTLDVRLDRADTVIFLDYPRCTCLIRVFQRLLTFRWDSRPDMAEGCSEHLDWEFFKWIWGYRSKKRPEVMKLLDKHSDTTEIVVLRSSGEAEEFLKRVKG